MNLWIVFLISGLWHGSSWTFLAWGAYHGLFLTLDRLFWLKSAQRINRTITTAITYVIILFSWVIFRSPDMGYAVNYSLRMLAMTSLKSAGTLIVWQEIISNRSLCVLGVAAFISFFPAFPLYRRIFEQRFGTGFIMDGVKFVGILILQILSVCALYNSSFNPFIYFRF